MIQIYFVALLYLLMLGLTLYNFWVYIIKQAKYKVLPLLMFYLITIALILLRIETTVMYDQWYNISLNIMPSLLKVNLGLQQAWIIVELSVSM